MTMHISETSDHSSLQISYDDGSNPPFAHFKPSMAPHTQARAKSSMS